MIVKSVGRGVSAAVVLKVGGRVDRVSGTKPPPKINAVPASLCLSSGRPVGSQNRRRQQQQQPQRSLGPWRPVTGTTCHRLHRSLMALLHQRHGRQRAAPPRRQFILLSHTHACIHKHSGPHKLQLPTPSHLQSSTGETGRPRYENSPGCWR